MGEIGKDSTRFHCYAHDPLSKFGRAHFAINAQTEKTDRSCLMSIESMYKGIKKIVRFDRARNNTSPSDAQLAPHETSKTVGGKKKRENERPTDP